MTPGVEWIVIGLIAVLLTVARRAITARLPGHQESTNTVLLWRIGAVVLVSLGVALGLRAAVVDNDIGAAAGWMAAPVLGGVYLALDSLRRR